MCVCVGGGSVLFVYFLYVVIILFVFVCLFVVVVCFVFNHVSQR